MTATNHALTGAIIGLTITNPVLALSLAFISHYVLDALPHFRPSIPEEELLRSKGFAIYLAGEAFLCFLLVVVLFLSHPVNWFVAAICAFVAAAPDLLSVKIYNTVRSGHVRKDNAYTRFAAKIQWFERPIGAVVEVVWFGCAVVILEKLL